MASVAVVVLCGALVALLPRFSLLVVGAVLLVLVLRLPPVPHLVLLLAVTAVVPYGVQNDLGIGGGGGSPGLLLTDVLLISGLVRVLPQLSRLPLGRRLRMGVVLVAGFVAVAALQFVHGLAAGRNASTAGAEFRVLLGFAAFLLAVPILCDGNQRRRLLRALPWLGLAVGLWGVVQWVFGIDFSASGDAGVQEGIRFTTAGRGQLQGGLFAFPVAIVMALAALMSEEARSVRARALLLCVLVLNGVSLLLTYERTFWVATLLGAGFVVVKAGGVQRLRAVVGGTAVALLALALMTTLAPAELTAARERLLSLSQYANDDSLRFRVTESRHVLDEIRQRPVLGSGLGATIFFGRPWDLEPPESKTFAHNGYLWLAWKVGIPGALLLWVVLFWSIGWFQRATPGDTFGAVRTGARGALLTLVVASVTFPSFNQLGITAVMGVLMAIGCAPDAPGDDVADAQAAGTREVRAAGGP
jgi:hypothetical protein